MDRILLGLALATAASGQRCERLIAASCSHLGYNSTALPNLMDQRDQVVAEKTMAAFEPLVHVNCSQHLRYFLCSVYAPMCMESVMGPVPPCRRLCETVQSDCEPIVKHLDLEWPSLFNCSRFPAQSGWCLQGGTVDSVTPQYCPPDFVRTGEDGVMICSPRCGADAYYRAEDKAFAERWLVGWAWMCFLSTAFTLITFLAEPSRFRYPERPIVYLALSYCILSFTYILRGAMGPTAVTCVLPSKGEAHIAFDAMQSIPCAAVFLCLHYFGLASSMWWVIVALSWFLSSARKWSSESLQTLSLWLHSIAWIIPAIFATPALLMHRASADELTGLCQVGEADAVILVLLPQAAMLLIGIALAALTGTALIRVRRAMLQAGRCANKLDRLMTRLAVFTVLIVCPATGYLACLAYEGWHRPRWRSLALLAALDCQAHPPCAPGPSYRAAGVEVALLRHFLFLAVGVASGMWVWSGKTCRVWTHRFASPHKPAPVPTVP